MLGCDEWRVEGGNPPTTFSDGFSGKSGENFKMSGTVPENVPFREMEADTNTDPVYESSGRPLVAFPRDEELAESISHARRWLLNRQHEPGYWVAEFEADTTLESYIILFKTFMGKGDDPSLQRYAKTIRRCMLPQGGWPIYLHGPPEISVSVLSYFALKLAGVSPDEPDMRRAREMILKLGGVTKANTYTKFYLAFFGQYDWEHVPAVPPEIIFLPSMAPINIYAMSSWSRAIFVPLSILYALKPVCPIPPEKGVEELFIGGRENADLALPKSERAISWRNFFLLTDKAFKIAERFPIGLARRAAVKMAEKWILTRFEHSGSLGAILPGMVNTLLALKCLGYEESHPAMAQGMKSLESLEIHDPEDGSIRVQPCHSPVWDTAISTYALGISGLDMRNPRIARAVRWLLSKEVKLEGDWKIKNPSPPSGWYFEFENEFYPDVDDTIMVMMALRSVSPRGESPALDAAIDRGLRWVLGMQSADGGWASFDRDNDKEFLTHIPFADHNAMIDPSTADITGRVLEMFALIAPERFSFWHPTVQRALTFLKRDQCPDGSWYGRWGVNYIYGTWQVLRGLRLIGEDMSKKYVRKAVDWLLRVQLPDGGWGERADSYDDPSRKGKGPSTPSQTAWAVMGLLAAGEGDSKAVRRGIEYLISHQGENGTWSEDEWTGTGFPRVFYMKYHYYCHYWPLMALAQYQRFRRGYRP